MRRSSEAGLITGRMCIGCQKKNKTLFCMYVCVTQHRNWPLRSTILNAHVTNASPDGLCTRTHTHEAFSCWFGCNSIRVDRARRGNVCLSNEGMLSYRSARRKFKDGLGINMTMKPCLLQHIMSCEKRSMEWCLRRVVPAAAVTTHAKPHAQQ